MLENSNVVSYPISATKNDSKFSSGIRKLQGGGIDRAFRCKFVISVALTGLAADTKCQFSGISPAFRRAIQRK